jgi:sugar O-acyltransferase (sialic acid O-acetyltransferase NeuD family)
MKDIAIYGAGGLGREVACLINRINDVKHEWNLIGFFDDSKIIGTTNEYSEILGGINELNNYRETLNVVIGVGSPNGIKSIADKITNPQIDFPNLIAPDVRLVDENSLTMGCGNIITWGCLLSCNVQIENFNILNGFISVGHDVKIGSFNAIMPAVRISGNVTIGDENFLGVGSSILQRNKIGYKTVVGANSVVMRNTKDESTYVGNPAKIIKY